MQPGGKQDFRVSDHSASADSSGLGNTSASGGSSVLQTQDSLLSEPFEGQLLKFTNVVKGWQPRWFLVKPTRAELCYYLDPQSRRAGGKPRGTLRLFGATVFPSEDDSLCFTVCPSAGEGYKLKAPDTRIKQEWVNRLRLVAQKAAQRRSKWNSKMSSKPAHHGVPGSSTASILVNVAKLLAAANDQHMALSRCSEDLISCDLDVLLLKSTFRSLLGNLEQCMNMLHYHQDFNAMSDSDGRRAAGRGDYLEDNYSPRGSSFTKSVRPSVVGIGDLEFGEDALFSTPLDDVDPSEEAPDDEDHQDNDLEVMEPFKGSILTVLSQMKLGMDLSRVRLPEFILQSKSFLETLSDYYANTTLLTAIADRQLNPNPEDRMLAVVVWYLTSFFYGTQEAIAKKPYNPLLGEIFRCHWFHPQSELSSTDNDNDAKTASPDEVLFLAEQVSHHPPVSAFYATSRRQKLHVNGCVWPKSKFMGMSIQCQLVGEMVVYLEDPGEVYRLGMPTSHARAILTSPWMELSGRSLISCPQSGLSATVLFHTKPFYGGKVHRVSADIKSSSGEIHCKISGEWNRGLEIQWFSGGEPISNLQSVAIPADVPKGARLIRPLSAQHPRESRRLWQDVTGALRKEDYPSAARHKRRLEDQQRHEAARGTMANSRGPGAGKSGGAPPHQRPETGPKYFIPAGAPVLGEKKEAGGPARTGEVTGWVCTMMPALPDYDG